MFRHGLMEGRVKYGNMRHIRKERLSSLNTSDIRWVVKRSKMLNFLYRVQNNLVNHHGSREFFSPMDDAMANSGDLINIL